MFLARIPGAVTRASARAQSQAPILPSSLPSSLTPSPSPSPSSSRCACLSRPIGLLSQTSASTSVGRKGVPPLCPTRSYPARSLHPPYPSSAPNFISSPISSPISTRISSRISSRIAAALRASSVSSTSSHRGFSFSFTLYCASSESPPSSSSSLPLQTAGGSSSLEALFLVARVPAAAGAPKKGRIQGRSSLSSRVLSIPSWTQKRKLAAMAQEDAAPLLAVPGKTTVGWIGTGVMGCSMCGHVMTAGFKATVFNRTISKAQPLIDRGAVVASSPKDLASQADVVFTILGFPRDVEEVILGEDGVLAGLKPGSVIVDMTTSEPSLARRIAEAAAAKGCYALDCPVSGGDVGARNAALSIMAGGDKSVVEAVAPLLSTMGTVTHLGPAGSGQSCKMANQVTIASTMVGMVEGLLYASAAGLDPETYLKALSGGAAGSRSIALYADRILRRDFAPGFFVRHFVKDLGIALQEAQKMNLSLPGLALAQQLYVSLMAMDEGSLGTQALALALERMNNRKIELPAAK